MNNNSDTCICDDTSAGFFRGMHGKRCVAIFNYCTENERGFFTKKQAEKLANKLARKMEKSTVVETITGLELKRDNTNDQR